MIVCRLRRIAPVLLVLGLLAGPAARARAGANPSVNWSITFAPYDMSDARAQVLGTHFDLMELEPGNLSWPGLIRKYNPNFKFFRYDNITNNNHGGHKDKWIAMQNYCVANGQDFERLWLHFSENTAVPMGGETMEDKLDRVEVQNAQGLSDQSYWAYGPDANTNFPFGLAVGHVVYAGHYDKFAGLDIKLQAGAIGAWLGTWEYFRNDSTWAALSVSDSTGSMNHSGRVRFTPPANWGFLTVDGVREYWVRLRCTGIGTSPPAWNYIRRMRYYIPNAAGTRVVPGWDPANDPNGDGFVSDAEYASRPNTNCDARVKCQSRIPSFYFYPPRYVAAVGDPLYRQLNAAWQLAQVTGNYGNGEQIDGIFEDNCIPSDGSITVSAGNANLADSLYCGNYSYTSGGHVLEYPGSGPGRRFHQDHLTCDSLTYRSMLAVGKMLEGNPSQFYCDSHLGQWDPQNVHSIVRGDSGGFYSFSVHSGAQREGWCIPKTTIDNDNSPVVTAPLQFKMAKELTKHGRFAEFFFRQSYNNVDYGPGTLTKERDRMFALAYFCMISNPYAYGAWVPVDGSAPAESMQWWPAIGYNFGTPQNDSVYVYQQGTDSNGQPYHIYARYFTNALVLVKPKPYWNSSFSDNSSPLTAVNLPTSMRRLNSDGTLGAPMTQIALKNIEGAIMVGSVAAPGGGGPPPPPPPPGDSTPPATTSTLDARFNAMGVAPEDQGLATTRSGVKVDLSEDVDPTSLTTNTVQASGSVSGAHTGTLNVVKRYLTFTPSTAFTPGERITVRLLGTLKSTSGRFLDGDANGSPGGDKVWTFTVGTY